MRYHKDAVDGDPNPRMAVPYEAPHRDETDLRNIQKLHEEIEAIRRNRTKLPAGWHVCEWLRDKEERERDLLDWGRATEKGESQ